MASHPRKFIVQPTDDELKDLPEGVKHLIKKGREQRYVTHQEINAVVPNAEENIEMLDEVYDLFIRIGIQMLLIVIKIFQKKNERRENENAK